MKGKLQAYKDSDKQFIDILQLIYKYGLEKVAHACQLTITTGGCSAKLVEQYLQPSTPTQGNTDEYEFIQLKNPPDTDCSICSKLYLKLWGNK